MESEIPLKIVTLGNTFVGKSCLLERWLGSLFHEVFTATVNAGYHPQPIELDGRKYLLQIWDTAGQDDYKSTTSMYCRNANRAIVVFSLSAPDTFQAIPGWISLLEEANGTEDVAFVLAGNKCDLPIEVDTDEIRNFCESRGILLIQTSAKTGEGVDDAFEQLLRLTIEKNAHSESTEPTPADILGDLGLADGNKECC